MLVFGLQWLRKAVLRSSGLKSLHDEEEEFRATTADRPGAGTDSRLGLDWFAFVVSFKGVFLEGVEIVFIVITFGLSAGNVPVAVGAALVAAVIVLAAGAALHRPLTKVPENTLKYVVGLLLTTFGPSGRSRAWASSVRQRAPRVARRGPGPAGPAARLAGGLDSLSGGVPTARSPPTRTRSRPEQEA